MKLLDSGTKWILSIIGDKKFDYNVVKPAPIENLRRYESSLRKWLEQQNKSTSEGWLHFSSGAQFSKFVDAILNLSADLIKRLDKNEIPFFFDYWLNRLNLCDVWIFFHEDKVVALLSKPKCKDIHSERWQYSTLLIDSNYSLALPLPFESEKPIALLTPVQDYSRNFQEKFRLSYFQRCYSRTTEKLPKIETIKGVQFELVLEDSVEKASQLLDGGYHWEGQPDGYIECVKTEISRAAKLQAGWCFMATRNSIPIALVSYLALQTPLLGVPSVIVGDLLVVPEERGKGIASNLQMFAYHRFEEARVRWIIGNIDPKNESSTK